MTLKKMLGTAVAGITIATVSAVVPAAAYTRGSPMLTNATCQAGVSSGNDLARVTWSSVDGAKPTDIELDGPNSYVRHIKPNHTDLVNTYIEVVGSGLCALLTSAWASNRQGGSYRAFTFS